MGPAGGIAPFWIRVNLFRNVFGTRPNVRTARRLATCGAGDRVRLADDRK